MELTLNSEQLAQLKSLVVKEAPWGLLFQVRNELATATLPNLKAQGSDPNLTYALREQRHDWFSEFNAAYDAFVHSDHRQVALLDYAKATGIDVAQSSLLDIGCAEGMKSFEVERRGFGNVGGFNIRSTDHGLRQSARLLEKVPLSTMSGKVLTHQFSARLCKC